MLLPNPERAVVDPAKIRDYLLAAAHPVGRFKATVFATVGYHAADWATLQTDILATAQADATVLGSSPFGQKYAVDAILRGPDRRDLAVRVIWLVRRSEDFPRFVTAYPRSRS